MSLKQTLINQKILLMVSQKVKKVLLIEILVLDQVLMMIMILKRLELVALKSLLKVDHKLLTSMIYQDLASIIMMIVS